MCQSMVNIQSPTAEIRRGKKKKKEERTNHSMKIYMVSLFHRATINYTTFLQKVRAYFSSVVKLQEYEIQANQTRVQLSVQEQC